MLDKGGLCCSSASLTLKKEALMGGLAQLAAADPASSCNVKAEDVRMQDGGNRSTHP